MKYMLWNLTRELRNTTFISPFVATTNAEEARQCKRKCQHASADQLPLQIALRQFCTCKLPHHRLGLVAFPENHDQPWATGYMHSPDNRGVYTVEDEPAEV